MLWTRKESVTKAIGKGLKHISSFSVMPFDNTAHIIDGQQIFSVTKQFLGFARRTDKNLVEFFKLFCRENSIDKARKLIEEHIERNLF